LELQDVLVFVPGLLGSELYGKVWPGSFIGGVFGFDEGHFRRLLAPNLRVGGFVETVGGIVDIYRRWLRAFAYSPALGGSSFLTAPGAASLHDGRRGG
jgi:hypothetical protein